MDCAINLGGGASTLPGAVGEGAHRSPPAARHRRKVLVVDDEPRVARVVAHAADMCGCQASIAVSSAAFQAEYERDPPDVVLLDLSLPGADGVELLRFLAERKARCPIFIVSGFDGRVVESAVRLGTALGLRMGGYLTKPITLGELDDALAASSSADPNSGDRDALCLG